MPTLTQTIARGVSLIDVHHQNRSGLIACCLIQEGRDAAIIDPGPASTLEALKAGMAERGVSVADLSSIVLTHIHLDHAGATGVLVRENPRLAVYVHEAGSRHLIDPSKLLASATRLYGDRMDELWGPVLPVPAAHITDLEGGERITVAARELDVAYTPGHASHHVSFFDPSTRIAFVGDVAGVRLTASPFVSPPTPPPDIDIAAWRESARIIQAWSPETLFLTHFGPATGVAHHFQDLLERLDAYAALVRESLRTQASDEERARAFVDARVHELRRVLSPDGAARYEGAAPAELNWYGLARYWRKRGEPG